MKTKYGYLKFIKWEGNKAIFKEAELVDIVLLPFYPILYILGYKEKLILIKAKYLPDKMVKKHKNGNQ